MANKDIAKLLDISNSAVSTFLSENKNYNDKKNQIRGRRTLINHEHLLVLNNMLSNNK